MISRQSMGAHTLVVVDFIWIDRIDRVGIAEQEFPTEDGLRPSDHRIDHRFVLAYLERVPVNLNPFSVVRKVDRGFPTFVDRGRYAVVHQTMHPCKRTSLGHDEPFPMEFTKSKQRCLSCLLVFWSIIVILTLSRRQTAF